MESTGERSKIQISEATADILNLAGKNHWLRKREDAVEAKGKGLLTTYWLNPSARVESNSVISDDTEPSDDDDSEVNGSVPTGVADAKDLKKERLVDWMVELLIPQIKKIVRSTGIRYFAHLPVSDHGSILSFLEGFSSVISMFHNA